MGREGSSYFSGDILFVVFDTTISVAAHVGSRRSHLLLLHDAFGKLYLFLRRDRNLATPQSSAVLLGFRLSTFPLTIYTMNDVREREGRVDENCKDKSQRAECGSGCATITSAAASTSLGTEMYYK